MAANKDNNNLIDELLVKYLLKETDEAENEKAEQWINASSEHAKYFTGLKQTWQSSTMPLVESPSEDEAWMHFQQRIHHKEQQRPLHKTVLFKRWAAAAAILILIIAASWIWRMQMQSSGKPIILASGDNIITDTLPDKTVVTLNKNSQLYYSKKFNGKNREVHLKGEAFFEVAQQKSNPFIVSVNHVTITVLGTSFNVNETGDATAVIVASGKVKVAENKQSVELTAHEKVTVSGKNGFMQKKKVDNELYSYYRTKEFICNNTPLQELISILNKSYNAHIMIADPQLGQLRLTTTFYHEQPLDSILSIISQTFNQVTFLRQGKKIILK